MRVSMRRLITTSKQSTGTIERASNLECAHVRIESSAFMMTGEHLAIVHVLHREAQLHEVVEHLQEATWQIELMTMHQMRSFSQIYILIVTHHVVVSLVLCRAPAPLKLVLRCAPATVNMVFCAEHLLLRKRCSAAQPQLLL